MKITLTQWEQIEAKIKAAHKLIDELGMTIFNIHSLHHNAGNKAEAELLLKHWEKVNAASDAMPIAYDFLPQTEWTGGDSSNPKNYKLREPHIVGLPQRKFTEEEIAEARAKRPLS